MLALAGPALTVMGVFASIYHPVGIPMLVQHSSNPGFTIGLNGLAGNLGIAGAAALTGLLVKYAGWRAAFAVPALIALACAALFAVVVPREDMPPAKRPKKMVDLPPGVMARVILVMTLAAISVLIATVNIVGGFFVTRRMLAMFQKS